jgi:uncharacterized protein YbjT (DUF2867 family)
MLAARGDRVRGLIRDADQGDDLREAGAEPVVIDLEEAGVDELAGALEGADAVVFAAGAGPGSGAARKETVDYGAAVKTLEAAKAAGVERYVIVSSMGADDPPSHDDVFSVYLRAKARADHEVRASDRAWTVLRPGSLTDDEGTGKVWLGRQVDRGEVPREDVAAVLVAILDEPRTAGHILELIGGGVPIDEAITAAVASG